MSVATATRVGALRRSLAARLQDGFTAAGREGTAALDARLLLAHALGVEAAALAMREDDAVDPAAEARALAFVERRLGGEPVARIVGRQAFWGLELAVGPDTLVPRPDTETVVEAALAFLDRAGRRNDRLTILDLGTGSGAILLALLSELPRARGMATDLSAGALAVARANAGRLGLAPRAGFAVSDWAEAIGGRFDLVVANPPYVESGAIAGLQIEVRTFDPHLALDGGPDGLGAHHAILADLDRLLAPGGRAFLEVGHGQSGRVAALAGMQGFSAAFRRDIAGIERVAELGRAGDG